LIGQLCDGGDRYASRKESQASSDPGQEGAFVGEGESWVGL
jgi:hypothetical protein